MNVDDDWSKKSDKDEGQGRFWNTGSDSESEEKSEKSDSEAEPEKEESDSEIEWSMSDSDDEDQGESKRVIKDAKTKAYERFLAMNTTLNNHLKIEDWSAILNDFADINDWIKQSNSFISQDGIPRNYLEMLAKLDETIQDSQKKRQEGATQNKKTAKSFNTLKQKLKKHITENYQEALDTYKKDPTKFPEISETLAQIEKDKKEGKYKRQAEDQDDEEKRVVPDGEWTEEDTIKALNEVKRKRGMKKTDSKKQVNILKELLEKRVETSKMRIEVTLFLISYLFDETNPHKAMKRDIWNEARRNVLHVLKVLNQHPELLVEDPAEELSRTSVLNSITSFVNQLDTEHRKALQLMDNHSREYVERLKDEVSLMVLAKSVQSYFQKLGDKNLAARMAMIRVEHLYYKLDSVSEKIEIASVGRIQKEEKQDRTREGREKGLREKEAKAREAKDKETAAKEVEDSNTDKAVSSPAVTTTPTPTEDQPKTTLKASAPTEDQPKSTLKASAPTEDQPKSTLKASTEDQPKSALKASDANADADDTATKDTSALMEELCIQIYRDGQERLRTRALLCHVYHHALNDRYYAARDMLLMSHIQDNVLYMDISTQVLYNRTLAQIGLCAFRKGLIHDAHSCLSELCSANRTRELLAQGLGRNMNSDTNDSAQIIEQEKLAEVQTPYHMHINLELLETVHLISAMLLEVPNMAAHPFDIKQKIISRSFHILVKYFSIHMFTGPPETTKDFIVAASRALAKGDWRKSVELLLGLPIWNQIGMHKQVDQVKAMLRRKVQEEGLRTYLFTYSPHYDSMSIESLAAMFELQSPVVHSLVSKMIINDELKASLDQPTEAIVMQREDPSRLQFLALQYAEKMQLLVDNNERSLEQLTGGYTKGADWKDGQKDGWRREDAYRGDKRRGAQGQGGDRSGGSGSGAGGSGRGRGGYGSGGRRRDGDKGGRRRGDSSNRSGHRGRGRGRGASVQK